MRAAAQDNSTPGAIAVHILMAFAALVLNGFGVYLTICADIGAGPWDVFAIGLSGTLGILYGNANILVCLVVLAVDIALREPIGLAMIIDSLTVGKTVDLFQYLDLFPSPRTLAGGVAMMACGLLVIGYSLYFYMRAGLGCGPRDALMVALKRRTKRIPIGFINITMLCLVTAVGAMLGGPVGIGTLIFALGCGPAIQLGFATFRFDATSVRHQNLRESVAVFRAALRRKKQ